MTLMKKISFFFIRNILKENFCGLAKVSLMLYKIITEPKAKKADTKNIVLNEYCVTLQKINIFQCNPVF